jgi:hypothetical protein
MNLQLTITDNNGNALGGVSVTLADMAGSIYQREATGISGSVLFIVDPNTSWQVALSKTGYSTYNTIVSVGTSDVQETLELFPVSSFRAVAITCVNSITYLPLAGAICTLVGTDSAITKAWTDQNNNCKANTSSIGLYSASVISGVYTLTVTLPGYEPFVISVDTTAGPVTETLLIIQATNTYPIAIQAVDETGTPIQGATVYIYDQGEYNGPFILVTDVNGSVNLLVFAGTYSIYINAPNYQVSNQIITIPEE